MTQYKDRVKPILVANRYYRGNTIAQYIPAYPIPIAFIHQCLQAIAHCQRFINVFSSTPSFSQIHDTCVIVQRWNSHVCVCMCQTLCNGIRSFLETFGMMFGTQRKSRKQKQALRCL